MKFLTSSGDKLVSISLVADVPNNLIIRCIEYVMKRGGDLYDPQAGSKVTPMLSNMVDQIFT